MFSRKIVVSILLFLHKYIKSLFMADDGNAGVRDLYPLGSGRHFLPPLIEGPRIKLRGPSIAADLQAHTGGRRAAHGLASSSCTARRKRVVMTRFRSGFTFSTPSIAASTNSKGFIFLRRISSAWAVASRRNIASKFDMSLPPVGVSTGTPLTKNRHPMLWLFPVSRDHLPPISGHYLFHIDAKIYASQRLEKAGSK